MEDWYKEFQRDSREQERNQELKRQNDLLDQQSWKQQAALEENNRIAREQQQALEERNRLERQRQWEEESRYQRELELRYEQEFKDRIFELKKLWASSQTDDERGRVQILLAEAEADYQAYLQEKAAEEEQKRLEAAQYQLQLAKEREKRKREEAKQKRRDVRNAVLGILFVLFLLVLGTRWFLNRSRSGLSSTSPSQAKVGTSSNLKSSSVSSVSKSSSQEKPSVSSVSQASYTKVDYDVEVQIDDLTLRDAPSTNAKDLGNVRKGRHRIVETTEADGYKWGLLKSRAGWIALDFTTKVAYQGQDSNSTPGTSSSPKISSKSQPSSSAMGLPDTASSSSVSSSRHSSSSSTSSTADFSSAETDVEE